ncbi:MAG: protein tyrosine phosphatase, partial [Caulobacterales bacterium]
EALEQLSLKYLHAPIGHTGIMEFFFKTYLEETRENGKSFEAWVREDYDPEKLARDFKPSALGEFIVDVILRRE